MKLRRGSVVGWSATARRTGVTLYLLLLGTRSLCAQAPQNTRRDLVGTWSLVSVEQRVDSGKPVSVPSARGLLVFDNAGHMLELVNRSNAAPIPGWSDLRSRLSLGGQWGSYRADTASKKITYKPLGAVSPNVMGSEFTRSFDLTGDRLTITSLVGEPHMNGATRWTWERVPVIAHLDDRYRAVVGFWQHVSERRVHATTGAVLSETKRAPSVIVYTPAGYVGVHFPLADRPRFTSAEPTETEERVLANYLGYFGALGVYPNMVLHHILSNFSGNVAGDAATAVATGNTLRRYYELKGDELHITFPPAINQDGQPQTTIVILRRLSGEKEMLGEEIR
jgi:hypothetical protein